MEELFKYQEEGIPVEEPARQYYFIDHLRELITAKETQAGRRLRACVVTFGCQMYLKSEIA